MYLSLLVELPLKGLFQGTNWLRICVLHINNCVLLKQKGVGNALNHLWSTEFVFLNSPPRRDRIILMVSLSRVSVMQVSVANLRGT